MYATGVGSLPGTDMGAALRLVLGSFDHAWLPELPARGVGADMVGRTTAMLEGLAVDLQPQGWRLADGSGVDHHRARSILRRDLDDLEEHAQSFTGTVTITATGPWTLASCLERPRGDKVLADHGARREVAESLGLGLVALVSEMRRRLPGTTFTLQLDEPMLPAVLAGTVSTASGFSRFRAVDRPAATALLAGVTGPLHGVVEQVALHCCAPWPPSQDRTRGGVDTELLERGGIDVPVLDASTTTARDWDLLGPWLEAGRELRLGLAPTRVPDQVHTADQLVRRGLAVLRPLGLDPRILDEHLSLTTGCGMAGWSAGACSAQLDALADATGLLAEELARLG